jgi:hypothetical protein
MQYGDSDVTTDNTGIDYDDTYDPAARNLSSAAEQSSGNSAWRDQIVERGIMPLRPGR